MLQVFGHKHSLGLGVIVSHGHKKLFSFEIDQDNYMLPYSPRFRNIDFAIGTLDSAKVREIFVFVESDKESVGGYLAQNWPLHEFYVFDKSDLEHDFMNFFEEHIKERTIDIITVIQGDTPVWFDMGKLREKMEKSHTTAIKTAINKTEMIPAMSIELTHFRKRLNELHKQGKHDLSVELFLQGQKPTVLETKGIFTQVESIEQYYRTHLDMIEDYLVFDQFHSIVPVKLDAHKKMAATIEHGCHFIRSIIGEGAETLGRIENSVIFSNVKVDAGATIKNSLILPGNHIGPNVTITNAIIDEFTGDNSLPNIEKGAVIGSEKAATVNSEYPDILNFGVTLVGKNANLPVRYQVGANCYIGNNVPVAMLRARKLLRDGESIVAPQAEKLTIQAQIDASEPPQSLES